MDIKPKIYTDNQNVHDRSTLQHMIIHTPKIMIQTINHVLACTIISPLKNNISNN
ncbi:MAG: hypothetical protein Gaeavirus24_8 [Gaeavirus sp.]|uniref:Uncharacterized protein n=1 Tax=Gaeavirus sp. TaxID=2487767 RepID=A0A3G4ZZI8_9VIRU|nr:MAG: hypothetical protein Gaeavirus24_8 [Gaeavirus sp.]